MQAPGKIQKDPPLIAIEFIPLPVVSENILE